MRFRYLIMAIFLAAVVACNKDVAVKSVDFDASSVKTTGVAAASFKTTDTVQYNFNGNPDNITFFSGEAGKNYEFRNRVSAPGIPQLQFSSLRANGTQTNSLSVLVSSDFKGVATSIIYGILTRDTATTNANIASATWTDITSRATLSNGATTPSGVVDMTDFLTQAKPVYIAFKYIATAATTQNKWTITGLTVNNVLPDGNTYTIANLNAPTTVFANYGNNTYSPGWAVSYDPLKNTNKYAWAFTDKTSLVITGATSALLSTAPAEAWAIMGPIDLSQVTPDFGVGIKTITAKLPNFTYKYGVAGTYNSVFVASNNTNGGTNSVVKQLPVTITAP